jgi:hypothetical protein
LSKYGKNDLVKTGGFMTGGKPTAVEFLARHVFRFETEHEMANLVASIDADTTLRQAVAQNFYRVSLVADKVPYCVILHDVELADEHRNAINRHAAANGGKPVLDERVRNTLSFFVIARRSAIPPGGIRWDDPVHKTN